MLKKIGKRLKDQRGLTLVELLAVVVILGIIAAIAVPSIGNIIHKTEVDAAKSDAVQILNAGKLYLTSSGTPTSDLTISQADYKTKGLDKYLDITTKNLAEWSMTITTKGEVTITSSKTTKGSYTKIVGDLNTINGLTFDAITK